MVQAISNSEQVDIDTFVQQFTASKWFTRGWTLQELLAPTDLCFYSATWTLLRTLGDLTKTVSAVTNIPLSLLYHEHSVTDFCAARRMSWAANRRTARIEDEAYCLLGLFQINMPLLYGERNEAFRRLQLEILRASEDVSILAWEHDPAIAEMISRERNEWALKTDRVDEVTSYGEAHLLARCPTQFARSGHLRWVTSNKHHNISIKSSGIELTCPVATIDSIKYWSMRMHCISLN